MTYFMEGNYKVYDALPCSAVVFEMNENLDIVYSNAVYNEMFASQYIKICEKDRGVFDKILAEADTPKCVYFKSRDAHGKSINVRAFVVKNADNKAFAIFIDESEHIDVIKDLQSKCITYAAAIRGTDEIFYEYTAGNDMLTIFFPDNNGSMESKAIEGLFENLDNNEFIHPEDKYILSGVKGNVPGERRLEFRMRLRNDEDFEWYRVAVKPDKENDGLFVGTARNIQDRHAEEEKLKEKALIDPLSKVYNRAAAIDRIKDSLQMRLPDCECALIVLDIDNFKRINDTFGHLYGDAVIAMAAGSIKATLDENDIMGRFGGDEFFVFIDNAEKKELEKKLGDIRQSVLKMRLDVSDDKDISCSIGVAIGKGGDEYEELFKKADSALYKAKENGKNRFEYFDGEYAEEVSISYAGTKDENESNEEHSITTVALEIASKSTNSENAIINIMRHIGITLNLDFIQIMRFDTLEDRVDLMFQWMREMEGEYNVVISQKRSGYYVHNDLVLLRNRFARDKIFKHTIDFEEGFSQKYRDVFKNLSHVNLIHSSNTDNEDIFYAVTFQSLDLNRIWLDSEMKDMAEITKILSMYLKSTYVETEREKMLVKKLDYTPSGAYSIGKFYDETGRIGRGAQLWGGRLGALHIDVNDMFKVNISHNWDIGNDLVGRFGKAIMSYDQSVALGCQLPGTDVFIVLFRTNIEDDKKIAEIVERELIEFCKPYEKYQNPTVFMKAGLSMFKVGNNIGYQIDLAKYAKKGKKPERCTCYISEM